MICWQHAFTRWERSPEVANQVQRVRERRFAIDSFKAEPFVQPTRFRAFCSYVQESKPILCRRDYRVDEDVADSGLTMCLENIKPTDSADGRISRVRVDIETTDPDDSPFHMNGEKCFSWVVKSIDAVRPLISKPTDESPAIAFALGDKLRKRLRREIYDSINHYRPRVTRNERSQAMKRIHRAP